MAELQEANASIFFFCTKGNSMGSWDLCLVLEMHRYCGRAIPLETWPLALGSPRLPCTYSRCGTTPELGVVCLKQSYHGPCCRDYLCISMGLSFRCSESGLASVKEMDLEFIPVCEDRPRVLLWGQALSPGSEVIDRLRNTLWGNI